MINVDFVVLWPGGYEIVVGASTETAMDGVEALSDALIPTYQALVF